MTKSIPGILGIGLVLLWIAGLTSTTALLGITWLDGLAAILALVISASSTSPSQRTPSINVGARCAVLAVGLYFLWIIGMVSGAPSFQSWWNFAFACAFLLNGIVLSMTPQKQVTPRAPEKQEPKKAA